MPSARQGSARWPTNRREVRHGREDYTGPGGLPPSLHRAYELFNRWEESSSEGQFYDENIETVDKVSEGFGLLESGLARLIADKMLFDLEMEYRQLQ